MEQKNKTKDQLIRFFKMPEGPEVHIISDLLHRRLVCEQNEVYLTSITINEKSKYYNKSVKNLDSLLSLLPLKINKIRAKGKKILFEFQDSEVTIISSLGLEGKWIFEKSNNSGVQLIFVNQLNQNINLYFDDSRHFGLINFCLNSDEVNQIMKNVGPDLLIDPVTIDQFKEKIKQKNVLNKQIVFFLMNQKYFSGIGNYLKSEILYASEVDPRRLCETLSNYEIEKIFEQTKRLLLSSYAAGGLTIRSYWDPEGRQGSFIPLVYSKKFDPFGNEVIKGEYSDKRTTFWVPVVQK